jgi:hypothetical protein
VKQVPGFLMWICRGSELESAEYRGKTITPDADAYYVAHRNRAGVLVAEAGPFASEARARNEAHAMTDTSGT